MGLYFFFPLFSVLFFFLKSGQLAGAGLSEPPLDEQKFAGLSLAGPCGMFRHLILQPYKLRRRKSCGAGTFKGGSKKKEATELPERRDFQERESGQQCQSCREVK